MAPRWYNKKLQPPRPSQNTNRLGISALSRAIRRRLPVFQGVVGVRAQRNGGRYTVREIQILGRVLNDMYEDDSLLPNLFLLARRIMRANEPQLHLNLMAPDDLQLAEEVYLYMQPTLVIPTEALDDTDSLDTDSLEAIYTDEDTTTDDDTATENDEAEEKTDGDHLTD
ncbi:hypothetical protein KR018_002565 [Drosophila ironensis]|nr:hypothetical protein KR018_002565 [Drosophila ironensis]